MPLTHSHGIKSNFQKSMIITGAIVQPVVRLATLGANGRTFRNMIEILGSRLLLASCARLVRKKNVDIR